MRLLDSKTAPSARRVTIYLAEKGIDLERVPVDLRSREQKAPEFLRKNSIGKVPVLELDNGTFLPESAAIVEYLEELYPEPPLIGTTSEERAEARASERIASDVFVRLAYVLLHSHPSIPKTRPGFIQVPQIAAVLQESVDQLLDQLEARIADQEFLSGARPTIADCTFYALMEAAYSAFEYELPERCPRLRAWHARFCKRPSAQL